MSIHAGITGGWGVDALLRRQARTHQDVDLGVASAAIDAATEALRPIGYRLSADQRPARVELTGERGRVDLHPIVWQASGVGIQTGLAGETYAYPPRSLDAEGAIGGRTVMCGTPELQVAFHLGYEPTEIDRGDMARLPRHLGWPCRHRTANKEGIQPASRPDLAPPSPTTGSSC